VTVSRSTLLKRLTEACELEHGLACSYLYSAMSLRQEPDGQFLPADKLPLVRQWASEIYFIASQEMQHLAQAWNLLVALGGTPYYLRPNFPQSTKYYPLHMPLSLEPFGMEALGRFIEYETPLTRPLKPDDGQDDFLSIGELYQRVAEDIKALPDAIIGDADDQVGRDIVDFPDMVRVTDVDSAVRAIAQITAQGEGVRDDRSDCHFGMFNALQEQLKAELATNSKFSPAYPAMLNPTTDDSIAYGAPKAKLIENSDSVAAAQLFDSVYSLMLRMLGYAYTPCAENGLRRAFGQTAIVAMVTVLKPLGETLVRMPAGKGKNAGPCFGLTRHVMLPAEARTAHTLVTERFDELVEQSADLASRLRDWPGLASVATTLKRLSNTAAAWRA
jgi:hypothetical protein